MKITPHQGFVFAIGGSCVAMLLGLLGALVVLLGLEA